jgi:uncharacterized protein (DUF488 family)
MDTSGTVAAVAARLLTVGHGTLEQPQLADLLNRAGVDSLVDIRTAPGSRRLPHVHRDELSRWLPASGIAYRWEKALGGFRKPRPDSPNRRLRNDSFRGYADYMETESFRVALDQVLAEAARRAVVVMCSESVWWRCHRRLVADFAVVARAFPVEHLMHDGGLVPHRVTEGARLSDDGLVRYDAGEPDLFSASG